MRVSSYPIRSHSLCLPIAAARVVFPWCGRSLVVEEVKAAGPHSVRVGFLLDLVGEHRSRVAVYLDQLTWVECLGFRIVGVAELPRGVHGDQRGLMAAGPTAFLNDEPHGLAWEGVCRMERWFIESPTRAIDALELAMHLARA
jgi:hypothetical protein